MLTPDGPGRYRVEFALVDGAPDWQVYTWADSPEHAAMMEDEASDGGRYRTQTIDEEQDA